MTSFVVRFAPSPTGRLHVGNVRTALLNWLFVRQHQGQFILRLDDTDTERSTAEFANGIFEDLAWLGLVHDNLYRQSERFAVYQTAIDKLKEQGYLYPCYESAEELHHGRKRQLAQGKPPIYNRAALNLTDAQKTQLEKEGRKPHWRFKLQPDLVTWSDLSRGELSFAGKHLSDPVLVRENGQPVYTLCSVVDDIELGITHIIRGEDHISNTAVQIQLTTALGGQAKAITYAHTPLLMDAAGKGLSKRLGSLSIQQLRHDGLEPMAILSLLAKLGTSEAIESVQTLQELTEHFDLSHVTKSSPKFSIDELYQLNGKFLNNLPFAQVQGRLQEMDLGEISAEFWQLIQPNLQRLEDVKQWWTICEGEIEPLIQNPDYIATAKTLLPAEPWTDETWGQWTQQLREATGNKGKQLFMPLREALTGLSHGPKMNDLLLQIGYQKALGRLSGERA